MDRNRARDCYISGLMALRLAEPGIPGESVAIRIAWSGHLEEVPFHKIAVTRLPVSKVMKYVLSQGLPSDQPDTTIVIECDGWM